MSLTGWHAFDIFFIILGCYFVIRGCFRGFIGEIITLTGFILALYLSFKCSSKLGVLLSDITGVNSSAAKLLAILTVWLVITLLVAALRKVMKGLLSVTRLSGFDRILGVFSGLIKTVLVVYVVLIGGFLLTPVLNPTWMTNSNTLRYAGRQWPEVRQILLDFNLLPDVNELPDGTLEQILRPYRTGDSGPEGYVPRSGRS